jgi:hypothetical protein
LCQAARGAPVAYLLEMSDAASVLSARLRTDIARSPAGMARIWIVLELTAGDGAAEGARPKLLTLLALDVSGSMRGEPLQQVARSVERIVGLLGDDDEVGLVAFSSNASEVAAVAPLSPSKRREIQTRAARLCADDRTNIEAGLSLGQKLVASAASEDAVERRRAQRRRDHGRRACLLELAQAVGAQGDIAVEGIEVTLSPEPGVEILSMLGASRTRYGAAGIVIDVADMAARSTKLVAVEVEVKLGSDKLSGALLSARAAFRRAGEKATLVWEGRATVDIGGTEPAVMPEARGQVLLLRADAVRAEARAMADRGQYEGAAAALRALMREMEAVPGYEHADGSALSEAREQLLDEAIAFERRPAAEMLATFKMSTAPKSLSSDGSVASSRSFGKLTTRFASATAGLFPEAYLVVVRGPNAGGEHRLQAQNTLGRTPSADVVLASGQVSRRHADVFALEGEFWIADLGSTNVTAVNGRTIGTKPHRLQNGDRIVVGDVEIAYRELAR